jgi:polyhydroxybutyrate depolymerase
VIRGAVVALAVGATLAGFAQAGAATTPCGRAAAEGATITIRQGSAKRTATVHVPTGYTAKKPVALVLDLHGSGSDADQQRLFSGMNKAANADGFVVAYPQGAIPEGSGFDWNVPGQPLVGGRKVPAGSPSDVAFVGRLITSLESSYCIDPHRVYATGFSGGARMSSQLACDLPDKIAAIAPVSGLRFPAPCPTTRSVPVLAFHGTADPVDPYLGHGQRYWSHSVPEAERRWSVHDGCAAKPTVSHPAAKVTLTVYSRCKAGAVVELYTIAGEGHEWPGGPTLPPLLERLLGPQSNAINADALMWKFFAAHPLS